MLTLTLAIVVVFIIGYFFIAIESVTKVNKAAVALLMLVILWTLFMLDPGSYFPGFEGEELFKKVGESIEMHLGSTSTTLFFLVGAMAIVEIVDDSGGFDFIRNVIKTKSKRKMLWSLAFMSFIMAAVLDSMATAIMMVMILRKLVSEHKDRLICAGIIIVASNAGAFSPIGNVTTIMLWNKGVITAAGVIAELFIPALLSFIVPTFILQYSLHGELETSGAREPAKLRANQLSSGQRKTIFYLGVGGLVFVPIFRYLTNLPPFVGVLIALGVLWVVTDIFYLRSASTTEFTKPVSKLIQDIDWTTILFFLGILMAVACLEDTGVLLALGQWLDKVSDSNYYFVTTVIGLLSSVVDNVPLVAASMGMYPLEAVGSMAVDGIFWQLLALCAGIGGSLLIIGSAAGVVVMGMEKISFGWYMKHISLPALAGYFIAIGSYWLLKTVFLMGV